MNLNKILVGAAGWSYADWKEHFYPKELSEAQWLSFYSKWFDAVEVNVTYYTFMNEKIVGGWLQKTENNPDFNFIIKLHQSFTHSRNYKAEEVRSFQSTVDILDKGGKLNGILIQFPYSFRKTAENVQLINKISTDIYSPNYYLELRHKSWNDKELVSEFRSSNIHLCWIDQPDIGDVIDWKPDDEIEKLYLRIHGRNSEAWNSSIRNFGTKQTYAEQSNRYNYLYNKGEIIEFVQVIKNSFKHLKELIIIANNHPNGNAVINAFEFLEYLKGSVTMPSTTENRMIELKRK